jgi:hypothetical protein
LFEGINPLDAAHLPTFARARAFVEHCSPLLNADGLLPSSRLELHRIPKLAPFVCLLGVLDDGEDFEVRLAGTRFVNDFLGYDPTGAKLSQAMPEGEFGKRSWFVVREVMRIKGPVLNQPGRTRLKSKDFLLLETVTWPLVDEAGRIAKIATFYDFAFEKNSALV